MTTTETTVWCVTRKTDGSRYITPAEGPLEEILAAQQFDASFALNAVRVVPAAPDILAQDNHTNGGLVHGPYRKDVSS